MKVFVILCCAIAFTGSVYGEQSSLWAPTDVDNLKSELLKNYDRLNRPSNYKTPTKLIVTMTVLHIELVESKSVLETHAWVSMNWTDSKLKWDPSKYNNIPHLRLTADEIWQPDLTVYNSAEEEIVDHFAKTNKIVYSSGAILWVPTAKIKTYCNMDLRMWPFDEQRCEIKFGSWTYDATQIELRLGDKPIDTKSYYKNVEWFITSADAEYHTKKYDCCEEPYEDVTFYLGIRRRSLMYKAIAVVPTITVVFMILVSLWLPAQSGEKLILNGFATILVCILLMYFTQLLPVSAVNLPLIVTFYSHTLYILAASLVISAFAINMSRKQNHQPLPSILKKIFLNNFIEKTFSCRKADKAESAEEGEVAESQEVSNENWIRLAVIIERIAFVVYVILFICMGFFHFI